VDADYSFDSQSPDETRAAARRLAGAIHRCELPRGLVLRLDGPLGTGKTLFVKGLAEGLGLEPDAISSPTFTLMNEYPVASTTGGVDRLAHVDLYRIESEAELEELGFYDLMTAGTVLAVEWGERYPSVFPRDHLAIAIERSGKLSAGESRRFTVLATGPLTAALLEAWVASATSE